MTQKLIDTLAALAEKRLTIENATDPEEKAAQARDTVVRMLGFVQQFLGDDVMRAAYGEIDPTDREEMLRIVALRVHTASMVFARIPEDAGSLTNVAAEAMAVAKGDAPVFFAQLPNARKRSWRVTKAKFEALAWDAYLDGLNVGTVERHSAIAIAFGHDWDTVSRWIKPARKHLSDQFVDYHLGKAKVEGMRGQPYSLSQSYHEAKPRDPVSWQDKLARDGARFLSAQRASKGA